MKQKIKFQELSLKSGWSVLMISLMLIGLTFIILKFLDIFEFENEIINKIINVGFFLILIIYHSRIFWYKNIVQWNKKGMATRINSFWGTNITFSEISQINFNENDCIVIYFNGTRKNLNLNNIDNGSKQRLNEILKSNIEIKI